jgi:hypothetical protein
LREYKDPKEFITYLKKYLGCFQEIELKIKIFLEIIKKIPPFDLIHIIKVIYEGALEKKAGFRDVLWIFIQSLYSDNWEQKYMESLLKLAKEKDEEIFKILDTSQTIFISQAEQKVPDYDPSRILTLGERKTLARSFKSNIRKKVLLDPHPHVIRILLQNPYLREEEVIELAARRPNPTEILEEIARNPRWCSRARIRYTLARNPYTPKFIIFRLLPFLTIQELKEINEAQELDFEIRKTSQRLIEKFLDKV